MADPGKLLNEALRAGWPTEDDFQQGRVFRPGVADEILERLKKYRRCILVGPPRSGKSTLALLIGRIVSPPHDTMFRRVRYLDLTEINDAKADVQAALRLVRSWLLIVDNWHARPDCHEELLKRINTEWGDAGVLFVVTRFLEEDEESPDTILPLAACAQGEEVVLVDITSSVIGVAEGMIDQRFKSAVMQGTAPGEEPRADEEDHEQALTAPPEHKKVRGNLRFLSWRLRAWDPSERHLRDVRISEVLDEVKRQIVRPCTKQVATLENVAALAQWELPYRRGAAENPDGIEHLERLNVVIPVQPATTWRMDPTDAYLFMLATSPEGDWENRTLTILKKYLESQPGQGPRVVKSVLSQATPETRTRLVAGLLESPVLLNEEKSFLARGLANGDVRFAHVASLVKRILRDFPADSVEADKRLTISAGLLSSDMGQIAGIAARDAPLLTVSLFLVSLHRDMGRFASFGRAFLEGYGQQALQAKLQVTTSRAVQRTLLRGLKPFSSTLHGALRPEIEWAPMTGAEREYEKARQRKREPTLSHVLSWLAQGSIERTSLRDKKIEFLARIDEEYLTRKLARSTRPCHAIQFLLNSALWLSVEETRRIAAAVSRIWRSWKGYPNDAFDLGRVVYNCWSANAEAASELVDLMLGESLPALVSVEKAAGLGRLLCAIEKVQPGAVERWCRDDVGYLSQLVLALGKEESLDELLVPLTVFAPNVTRRVIATCSHGAGRSLLEGTPGRWSRHGVLALAAEWPNSATWDDLPDERELGSWQAAEIVFALYAIQKCLPVEGITDMLFRLSALPDIPPFVPLLAGRHAAPWADSDVVEMVRAVLRGGANPRVSAIESLVLAATLLPSIDWEGGRSFDWRKAGHRALQCAIGAKMLWITRADDSMTVHAYLNNDHPSVESIRRRVQGVLAPVRLASLTLTEWDAQVATTASRRELDYWRSKLLQFGVVRWSVGGGAQPLEVRFAAAEPEETRIRQLIDLPPATVIDPPRGS